MAPNDCLSMAQQEQTHQQQQAVHQQIVKIVTTLTSDDVSSEDGEHFYDASSDVGHEAPANDKADSGVGEDSDFDLPEQQLAEQIVEQVEYYFSDAHILKDAFLLKHARRNRDGFISLKLITSFKKVKHVTKDWRVVAYAVRALSKRLEVNEAGTKVRRVAPLPETDETSPSRTVVAIGLTSEKANIESVAEMFSGNGSIALIRILRPGSTIPPDVRQCANRHPDILTSVCAVVEFEQAESARRALLDSVLLPEGVRLVELAARRNGGSSKSTPNSSRPVTPQPPSEANTPNNRRKRRPGPAQPKSAEETVEAPRSPFIRRHDLMYNSSNSSTPSHSPQPRRHMQHLVRPIAQQQQLPSSPAPARPKSASCSETVPQQLSNSPPSSNSSSPWVRRRLGLDSGRSSPLPATTADNRLSVPANIVRMPNGPDGTRGFHFGGKPRSASAPEAPLMVM